MLHGAQIVTNYHKDNFNEATTFGPVIGLASTHNGSRLTESSAIRTLYDAGFDFEKHDRIRRNHNNDGWTVMRGDVPVAAVNELPGSRGINLPAKHHEEEKEI